VKASSNAGSKKLPLAGCRVLVSRAKKQAGALSSALRELGCEVLEIPFIEIRKPASYRPLDESIKNLASYDWLILTSVNGVEALFGRLSKCKLSAAALAETNIAAIGPATRKAIEAHGVEVRVTPKEYVAESVVRALSRRVKGKRVLLVRAKVARDVIPRELRNAGASVDVIEAYETVAPESSKRRLLSALANGERQPHAITFTSSSTVKNFVLLLGVRGARGALKKTILGRGIHSASIGPVTSATLREVGLPVDIEAREYTIPGLVAAILKYRRLTGETEKRSAG
jgi:uroporphyrinogen-III synthase